MGAGRRLSQHSPEPTEGKDLGWSLGKGNLEPGEERGQVARVFSGSFAPKSAGQKELPGEPSIQLHLKSLCLRPSGSPEVEEAWVSEIQSI